MGKKMKKYKMNKEGKQNYEMVKKGIKYLEFYKMKGLKAVVFDDKDQEPFIDGFFISIDNFILKIKEDVEETERMYDV